MSYSISTLLTRNLRDVFGENDPARRRAAIDEIFTEDGVFYDPKTGVHRGRDQIVRRGRTDFDADLRAETTRRALAFQRHLPASGNCAPTAPCPAR